MPSVVHERHRALAVTSLVPVDRSLPRVCMIGAGSSGIAAAKQLAMAGVPFDCFERSIVIGGTWHFDNPNGTSACYETLEINTSARRMAFSDFPMPAHYSHYARNDQVQAYFEQYVDHFGFRDRITLDTEVVAVTRAERGRWQVRTAGPDGEREREYDAVLVANGHHWDARWPSPADPGPFDGQQLHSHEYRTGEQLVGCHVVVVGAGNSAMDIAVEASHRAASATLSVPRPVGGAEDGARHSCRPHRAAGMDALVGDVGAAGLRRPRLRGPATLWPAAAAARPWAVASRAVRPHPRATRDWRAAGAPRHRTTGRRSRGVHRRVQRALRPAHLGDRLPRLLPVPRPDAGRSPRQRAAALEAHRAPRPAGAVLPGAAAADRRHHAAGEGAERVDRRAADGRLRHAGCARGARADAGGPRAQQAPLLCLAPPHHGGRLRPLPVGSRP